MARKGRRIFRMNQEKGHQHVVSVQTELIEACEEYLNACDTSTKMDLWRRRRDIAIEYLWYKADLERIGGKKRIHTFQEVQSRSIHRHDCPVLQGIYMYMSRSCQLAKKCRKWAQEVGTSTTYLAQARAVVKIDNY